MVEATAAGIAARRPPGSPTPAAAPSPPAPGAASPVLRRRLPAGGPPFGPGFARGVALSLLLHGVLGAVLALRLLGGGSGKPPPGPFASTLVPAPTWEPEPEHDLPPPEAAPPPLEEPVLLEPVEASADPRLEEDPFPAPGEPAPVIGVAAEGGRRAPRRVGRGGRPAAAGEVAGPALPPPPAPSPPAAPGIHRDARPDPDRCAPPPYPRYEEERGVAGTVRLRVSVGADGRVLAVAVEESSGSEALDRAAAAAVARWVFHPATLDGVPRESVVLQPVTFRRR